LCFVEIHHNFVFWHSAKNTVFQALLRFCVFHRFPPFGIIDKKRPFPTPQTPVLSTLFCVKIGTFCIQNTKYCVFTPRYGKPTPHIHMMSVRYYIPLISVAGTCQRQILFIFSIVSLSTPERPSQISSPESTKPCRKYFFAPSIHWESDSISASV